MAKLSNIFTAGRMDKDLDERAIQPGTYRDALNIIVGTSEGSDVGAVQNSLGNTMVTDIGALSGRSTSGALTIGAVKYERDNLIYWIVAGDFFDGIYEYNEETGTTVRVLQSNKATPSTPSKLNLNQSYLITGINYISGFLYWTDNYNPPRKINISRAKSYNVDDSRIVGDIDVILAPPLKSPKIKLENDATIQTNNMSEKFLYFSYRFKYVDGQYSAMSPFSSVAFFPSIYNIDYDSGNNKSMVNAFNSAVVSFETGSQFVKEIQLLVRDTRSLNVSIVESFNKKKLGYSDNVVKTFKFNNSKTYTVLTQDEVTRLFDNVPLLALAQDFVGDRLMYGNYTQFRDMTDCDNNDINIKLGVSLITQPVVSGSIAQTFRSDRDYEIGIVYSDTYGRATTVFTSGDGNGTNNNNTLYIPAINSVTSNSMKVTVANRPPCWATNWKLVIKQSKDKYYNIFPILFYRDGLFRYFMINESDRDKFKVGEYVIFKSDASGPTLSNKKYKILEFENKNANFIAGGSIAELPGLYFKIKVDSMSEITSAGIFTYASTGVGGGIVDKASFHKTPFDILSGHSLQMADNPIFYGTGNGTALVVGNSTYTYTRDVRFILTVDGPNTFKYHVTSTIPGHSLYGNPAFVESNVPIIAATSYNLKLSPSSTATVLNISWNSASGLTVGDKWIINCRSINDLSPFNSGSTSLQPAGAIVPGAGWSATAPETDLKIKKGAVISLTVKEDTFNDSTQASTQTFPPSPAEYANIEEWWYESGAAGSFIYYDINGANIGASNVRFRRGKSWALHGGSNTDFDSNAIDTGNIVNAETLKYPVRLILFTSVLANTTIGNGQGNNQSKITLLFGINQQDNATICETDAADNPVEIYHELTGTYRVNNDFHVVTWRYSDFTDSSGNTNLGQESPGAAITENDYIHYFSVGDQIYVKSDDPSFMPNGLYTILSVPDDYNIVLDFAFPGAGPVTGGGVSYNDVDTDQSNYSTAPAMVQLNTPSTKNSDFNGWTFGNGLESDRILDDWNEATTQYSVRANSTTEEYKKRLSENAICYSGIFGINTGINRLNSFNLSIANFKYLDKAFGSIQKLHARDTDLLVFQDNKISSVLYGKNLLVDAVGGGQIASIPEVLGTQLAFQYENGISRNPESFAAWGDSVFCTDSRRGTVLQIVGNQIREINNGMTDFFRDLMRDNPNKQRIGAYDPHYDHYVLAANDRTAIPCDLELSSDSKTVAANTASIPNFLFTIITNNSWTLATVDLGFGTSWVSNFPTQGYGTQDITAVIAVNTTGNKRSVGFEVTYCFGETKQFVLTQGRDPKGTVIVVVKNKPTYQQTGKA
jgi:hypothetical protein